MELSQSRRICARLNARCSRSALDQIKPGAVFGALAAGSDILVAEAALACDAELHVVLPMRELDFIEQSVAPYGDTWRARFHACLQRAATSRLATHEPFLGDGSVFAYGTEIAMGLAVRRSELMQTEAVQLALWDGVQTAGVAGTAADVSRWALTGRRQSAPSRWPCANHHSNPTSPARRA